MKGEEPGLLDEIDYSSIEKRILTTQEKRKAPEKDITQSEMIKQISNLYGGTRKERRAFASRLKRVARQEQRKRARG